MARKSTSMSNDALLTYAEAAAFVAKRAARLARTKPATERVTLAASAGRVLAETLRADTDQPPFARSTRDGFACRAAEASAHRPLAIAGATRAGDPPSGPLPHGAVWEIMTGAPVPRGADAVIMLEHVETAANRIRHSNHPPLAAPHHQAGRKHRPTWRAGPQRRCVAARRNPDRRRADCSRRVLRLHATQGLRQAPRGHSFDRRRACAHRRQTQARPDSQLELGHAGRNGRRGRRQAVDSAHRPRHRQITRRRARPRRHGRSSAHHRRRLRRKIRSRRARPRPHGSPLPFHRRAHAAGQAGGVRRVRRRSTRAQPKPGPARSAVSWGFRAIPSPPPSPSCSSPRRFWPRLPAGAISGPASLSRASPPTSRQSPASRAFYPPRAPSPAPSPKWSSFPGKAPAISPPWRWQTAIWSSPMRPIPPTVTHSRRHNRQHSSALTLSSASEKRPRIAHGGVRQCGRNPWDRKPATAPPRRAGRISEKIFDRGISCETQTRKTFALRRIRPGHHGRCRLQAAHAPHRHRFGLRRALRHSDLRAAHEPQRQSP